MNKAYQSSTHKGKFVFRPLFDHLLTFLLTFVYIWRHLTSFASFLLSFVYIWRHLLTFFLTFVYILRHLLLHFCLFLFTFNVICYFVGLLLLFQWFSWISLSNFSPVCLSKRRFFLSLSRCTLFGRLQHVNWVASCSIAHEGFWMSLSPVSLASFWVESITFSLRDLAGYTFNLAQIFSRVLYDQSFSFFRSWCS